MRRDEGIIGIDHDAAKCPICGAPPRIHVYKFTMEEVSPTDGKKKKVKIRKSYYDCSRCGSCITQWHEDPLDILCGQPRYTGFGARDAWNNGEFL